MLSPRDGPFRVPAGEWVPVAVSLTNGSGVTIGALRFFDPHPLFLGDLWTERDSGSIIPPVVVPTPIWQPLAPGQQSIIHVRARAPQVPGRYILWIALFQDSGRGPESRPEVQPLRLDVEVCEDRTVLPHSINDYEDSVFSQNGEDGILRELFLRLGFASPFTVEIGAGDGIECNTAYWLRQYGWHGLLIEAGHDEFTRLERNYRAYPGVVVGNDFLTSENIAEVFRRYHVPREFDVLSIDVDGNDYWLWAALQEYRPRVVVIEINMIEPPRLWVMAYNPKHVYSATNRNYHGASLESLAKLGKRLGYALLGSNGVNAFFVRSDLLGRARFPERSATEAWPQNLETPPGWKLQCEGPYEEV